MNLLTVIINLFRGVRVNKQEPLSNKAQPKYMNDIEFTVDERSKKNIATLQPELQEVAIQFLKKLKESGIDARIISGTRTYKEQDDLYSKGRFGNPGPVVTNAKAGYSNHNFGIAFDIGIFNGKDYLESSPLYKKAGEIGESLGLTWGGRWKAFPDEPHFELRPLWAKLMSNSKMLETLRKEKGQI